MSAFVIRFDFPEVDQPIYAGRTGDGSAGFAPTISTADRHPSEEVATRWLNAYGSAAEFGRVVPAELERQ